MKHLFGKVCSLLLAVMPLTLQAQDLKLLSIEENTEDGIGVYPCGERHEAMVQFVTSESFGLEFRSNYDPDLTVQVDSVAGKKTYSIVFITQAPGVSYDGRRLTVMVPGFRHHTMTLSLRDKQKFVYTVSDPYSALRSPYFVYQDKGNDLFYQGQYQGAKDAYQMIRVCPEYAMNKEAVDERIVLCDSMIVWSTEALRLEQFAQYKDAADKYYSMLLHNSGSEFIKQKIGECREAYVSDCENEYVLAEHYMDMGQIESARASYQRIVDKKCTSHITEATTALYNLRRHDNKQAQHARCLFYEIGPNQPIGLTFAQCYSQYRRSSGYVSLRFNAADFKSLVGKNSVKGTITDNSQTPFIYQDKYIQNSEGKWQPEDMNMEASVSFGWTVRAWRYFFFHLGVGYHGGGFYTYDANAAKDAVSDWSKEHSNFDPNSDFNSWDEELRHDCMKVNWFHGVAPEGGLIVKVWRLNAKATYQHSIWLNKGHYKDFLEDNTGKLYFGLGFNW